MTRKVKLLKFAGSILARLVFFVTLVLISITVVYPAILRFAHRIETASGIDSMETVEIGGIYHALYFRGQDVENPVILVLHGGPGMPDMPQLHNYQFELEHYFTFVRWDQRNAGKTFFLNNPEEVLETLTFARVLSDAYEITQHIRERLNKEQIIILGHSWGSVLGSALVQRHPQYFSAYIAVGQVVNMHESERLGFEAVLEAARANGNSRSIAEVEALGPPPQGGFSEDWISYLAEIRALMGRYGLGGNFLQLAWISMTSPYYTLRENMYFITVDVLRNQLPLLEDIFSEDFDIRNFGAAYQIPVFYIMGELDRQTSYQLAKEFFEEISAPYKAFFSIPNAGHFPMHENTIEYNRVLIEEIRPLLVTEIERNAIDEEPFDVSEIAADERFFWDIISSLNITHTIGYEGFELRDHDLVIPPLVTILSNLSDREIFTFHETLATLLFNIDCPELAYESAELAGRDWVSGSSFLYARTAVIANGEEHYNLVQRREVPINDDLWFEDILYAAMKAWGLKHGRDWLDFPFFASVSYETGSNLELWEESL